MLIEAIRNARVLGSPGLVDVILGGGSIRTVQPAGTGPAVGLDARGRAVIPGLVDAHVHLDKAFQLEALSALGAPLGTLDEALAATARVNATRSVAERIAAAERLLRSMVEHGTTAARVHVELGAGAGLESVRWHCELAERWADRIALQLVAFPQSGLFSQAGMIDLLDAALDEGCDVVGACPYADDEPVAHIDAVVELAERKDRPLDLHLDFTDDPTVHHVDEVIAHARTRGWRNRVVVGHVTSLAGMSRNDRAPRVASLAAGGIGVVSLPATDVFLGGRSDPLRPRAVVPLAELFDAGVDVALATNNVANGFTPYGDGDLLKIAWLGGLLGHIGPGDGHGRLLDAVTAAPARMLGLEPHLVAPGAAADLVVLDAVDPLASVAGPAPVVAVVHAGGLTFRSPALG